MEYTVQSATLKSKHHQNNEDSYSICDDYIIIADGMGGECKGDIASRIAVDTIEEVLSNFPISSSSDLQIKELSVNAILSADSKIMDYIDNNPDSFGMGTTVLLGIRKRDMLYISWCGDSHCYAFCNGHLKSITKDHSYVQELIDLRQITEKESYTHPDNNLITRYVGGGRETCVPDLCCHEISDSDIIILCSDGLSGYCQLNAIENAIAINRDLTKLPSQLLNLAVQHGSDDDITIVVLYPDTFNSSKSSKSIFRWLKNVIHM